MGKRSLTFLLKGAITVPIGTAQTLLEVAPATNGSLDSSPVDAAGGDEGVHERARRG